MSYLSKIKDAGQDLGHVQDMSKNWSGWGQVSVHVLKAKLGHMSSVLAIQGQHLKHKNKKSFK